MPLTDYLKGKFKEKHSTLLSSYSSDMTHVEHIDVTGHLKSLSCSAVCHIGENGHIYSHDNQAGSVNLEASIHQMAVLTAHARRYQRHCSQHLDQHLLLMVRLWSTQTVNITVFATKLTATTSAGMHGRASCHDFQHTAADL